MRKLSCFALLAVMALTATISLAQKAENPNPYAIFGGEPRILGGQYGQKDVYVVENFEAGSPVARIEHNPRTGQVRFFDEKGNIVESIQLGPRDYGWGVPDPKAEKYYSTSPYAYANNNPVRYVDPNGMEWKNAQDEEIAKRMQAEIASRQAILNRDEARIIKRIESIHSNAKLSADQIATKVGRIEGSLANVQGQINALSYLDSGISQLGSSSTVYSFNTVTNGEMAVLSSTSDGGVIINNYGTLGNRAHETTHAIQHDNGQIKFVPYGSSNVFPGNSAAFEINAYRTEYAITGGIVPTSTVGNPRTINHLGLPWLKGLYRINEQNQRVYPYANHR